MSPTTERTRAWVAWGAVCLIWGTTYLAIKVALDTIPPFLMGGLRYVAGGAILVGWLRAAGRPLPPPSRWPQLAVLGFFMLTLGNGGVAWGEQYLASGLTAVIIATTPFWMVTVDSILPGGGRLGLRQWLGLVVGFGGIVLLVGPDVTGADGSTGDVLLGVLALQVACCGWAIASALTRRHVVPSDVLGVAALQMIAGGLFLVLLGTATGEWAALSFSARTSAALAYLIIFGSLIAFAAYSYALRHLPVAIVSLYTYVNPVIAVALGTVLLGEPFRVSMLLAGGIIVAGIFFVRPATGRRVPVTTSSRLPAASDDRNS